MSSIKLLSDADLAINATNFPALVHVFNYAGCDFDAGTITDPINGAVLFHVTGVEDKGDGSFDPGDVTGSTGIIAPGTTDCLLVGTIKQAINNNMTFSWGNSATYGIAAKPGEEYVTTNDGSNYHTLPANNLSSTPIANAALAVHVKWADGANGSSAKYCADSGKSAANIAAQAGVPANSINAGITQANIDSITDNAGFPGALAQKITGMYMFKFTDGLPEDIAEGVAWMANNHGKIYPGWQGMA